MSDVFKFLQIGSTFRLSSRGILWVLFCKRNDYNLLCEPALFKGGHSCNQPDLFVSVSVSWSLSIPMSAALYHSEVAWITATQNPPRAGCSALLAQRQLWPSGHRQTLHWPSGGSTQAWGCWWRSAWLLVPTPSPHCTQWGISQNRLRGLSLPGCTHPTEIPFSLLLPGEGDTCEPTTWVWCLQGLEDVGKRPAQGVRPDSVPWGHSVAKARLGRASLMPPQFRRSPGLSPLLQRARVSCLQVSTPWLHLFRLSSRNH